MKIAILVEGSTEVAFKKKLQEFLKTRLEGKMPRLNFVNERGRIPKEEKLRRVVEKLLSGKDPCDAVIALTDVYTGTRDFQNAEDAKAKMKRWVGDNPKFYPHVALHDFEAWLLPYWPRIQALAQSNKAAPSGSPESINHDKPPSYWIKETFRVGKRGTTYNKPQHGYAILKDNDLSIAINACPELKAFLNTIISLCDEEKIIP